MKLREFNTLNVNSQVNEVFKKGAYVADRCEQEFTIVLYKLGRFCVEVFYHDADAEPFGVKSFVSAEKLSPYFNQMGAVV